MTGYSLDNLIALTENQSIGSIVAAGFWEKDTLVELLDADPHKLIILEPEKQLYSALSASFADSENVNVHNLTLADKAGDADYFLFKPNRFSSLLKPKQLLKIYRKNSINNITAVNVCTLRDVCVQEDLTAKAGNILLLGGNASLNAILSDNLESQLSLFDAIVIRQPKQGLYETDEQQDTLISMLAEHKFSVMQEVSHDAMFSQIIFVRDFHKEKIELLSKQLADAKSSNVNLEKALAEAASQASQAQATAAELNKNNEELKAQCEQVKTQVSSLEQSNSVLVSAKAQLDNVLAQEKTKVEKLSTDGAQQQGTIEQLNAQVNQLQAKQNELMDGHKNKNAKINKLTQQLDQQQHDFEESKKKNEALKEESEKIQVENTQLKERKAKLSAHNKKLITENEKLNVDSAQSLAECEKLSTEIASIQSKQNEFAAIQRNKDVQIKDLQGSLSEQTATIDRLEQSVNDLSSQLELANTEATKLKNDLEISSKDNAQLFAKSDELNKALEDTRLELENELKQGVLKKQQLIGLTERVRELEAERVNLLEKQQAIDLEMAKVEVQIELIKDVVIREKAF